MQQLTSAAEQTVQQIADRYRVSIDAVKTLLVAVINGNGSMAQFYHPELGGGGQWMRGGMTMVGDMFNYGLQGTVSGICSELSNLTASQQVFVPAPPVPYAQGSQSQYQGGSGFGQFGGNWWPSDLGSPSSSGGQNDSRYAYFPQARRLAVQQNGNTVVYDTLDHNIGGVQQQQGGPSGSQSFSSQFGTFTVDSLPIVSGAPQNAPSYDNNSGYSNNTSSSSNNNGYSSNNGSNNTGSDDVIAKLERLGALRDKGLVTEAEFQSKKAELLSRF